jgi:PhnB protein
MAKKPAPPSKTAKAPAAAPPPPAKAAAAKPAAKPALKKAVSPIPADRPRVSPYLVCPDAARAVAFVERVLGGKVTYRLADPQGRIQHAEVRVGDSVLMFSEASDAYPASYTMLSVYVESPDATYAAALALGATSVRPPADQFYGDRSAGVRDHAGNQWWFNAVIEDVSEAEIARRAAAQSK